MNPRTSRDCAVNHNHQQQPPTTITNDVSKDNHLRVDTVLRSPVYLRLTSDPIDGLLWHLLALQINVCRCRVLARKRATVLQQRSTIPTTDVQTKLPTSLTKTTVLFYKQITRRFRYLLRQRDDDYYHA